MEKIKRSLWNLCTNKAPFAQLMMTAVLFSMFIELMLHPNQKQEPAQKGDCLEPETQTKDITAEEMDFIITSRTVIAITIILTVIYIILHITSNAKT